MGSHGADGNGGGMEKGNPGTPATGAAAAAPSAPVWVELLAADSADLMCKYYICLQWCTIKCLPLSSIYSLHKHSFYVGMLYKFYSNLDDIF